MLRALSLSLLLCLAVLPLPASAQRKVASASGLTVEGDVVLTVRSLPFKVVCTENADLYFWRLPPGWVVSGDEGGVLSVTAAPEGAYVVGLQTVKIDYEAKRTTRKSYALTVHVGKVAPVPPGPVPPGPDPTPPLPPGPDDPLAASLRAAWAKEKAPDRVACLATLAAVWRRAEKRATDVKYGDVGAWAEANRVDRLAVLADEALWEVRTAIAAHQRGVLPRNPMAPMDEKTRALCARESARVAGILEGLK